MEDLVVKVDGKEYNVKVEEIEDGKLKVYCGGDVYEVEAKPDTESSIDEIEKKSDEKLDDGNIVIKAQLPGTIFSVNVKKGDKVKEGQALIKLMAMKMENEISAPKTGTIKEVKVKKNDNVNRDDILIILE